MKPSKPDTPLLLGIIAPTMGSGKTTIANRLCDKHGFTPLSFASPLKMMLQSLLVSMGFDQPTIARYIRGDLKEEAVPGTGRTARQMMQTLGGDWGRGMVSEGLWVDAAMKRVKHLSAPQFALGHRFVFDDVRYLNEVEAITSRGGRIVRVFRPGTAITSQHTSEGVLDDYPANFTIENNGSVADLDLATSAIAHTFLQETP
jgi:hypothetical protein